MSAEDRAESILEQMSHIKLSDYQFGCVLEVMLMFAAETRSECIEICKHHYRALDAAEAIERLGK